MKIDNEIIDKKDLAEIMQEISKWDLLMKHSAVVHEGGIAYLLNDQLYVIGMIPSEDYEAIIKYEMNKNEKR